MKTAKRIRRECSGYTLLEVAIAASLMSILTYSFVVASNMGSNSYRAVERASDSTKKVRDVGESIKQEFMTTDQDNVNIVVLPDGNHQVTFQQPLILAGALTWGAYDATWGPNEVDKNQPDWWIRYTVQDFIGEDGDAQKRLVRQVLDVADIVQEQDTVATNLRSGAGANPGFQVTQTGDVWVIQMYTEGQIEGSLGEGAAFNVRIRN